MIVPPRLFKKLLSDEQYTKYKMHLVNSFVDISKQAKFCPGRDCNKIVEQKTGEAIDIHCSCGHSFCFGCLKDAHMPIDCELLQQWKDRVEDEDGDNSNWIKINTKPCPKCKRPIEKNSGCMHMTCSQCRYEFCWLCMGDYRNHQKETGTYLCNSFEDVKKLGRDKKGEVDDVLAIERELKRLDHYKTRYQEHFKAINFSTKAKYLIHEQIATAIELNNSFMPMDFEFLTVISNLIITVRRSLSFTYAIRYYLKGP
jgi:ariadne-1